MNQQQSIPAGYKQTDLGVIPEDWEVNSLGEIGEVKMCKRVFNDETKEIGTIPFYKIGTFGKQADSFISPELYEKYRKKFSFPKVGEVLISAAGTIGRTVVYDGKPAYFQDSNIVWIDNNEKLVSNKYLNFVLKNIKYNTEGGTIQRLYNGILKSTKFTRPSKPEQTKIAQALSDIDSFISKLTKLIQKKRQIKQALMEDLLTGKKRLSKFSGEWEEKILGKTSTLKARIGWQGLTTAEYLDYGDYFLVTGTDFGNGEILWETCHFVEKHRYDQDTNIQLKPNDVLVTKDGTIGKVALVKSLSAPATLNSGVFVIRPKNGNYLPQFLYYILRSSVFGHFLNELAAGSTISHLYQKDFVNFSFRVPKDLAEQEAIAQVLSDIDAEINSLEKQKSKYIDLKQGMMQQLLTGKIRLI